MAIAFEVLELINETTDANGYIYATFTDPLDQVLVTGNGPQAGSPGGIVGVTAWVTGTNTARARVFVQSGSPDAGSVIPAVNRQVTVTFIGLKQA